MALTLTIIKLHAILGLALIVAGILFDFGFVTTMKNFSASLEKPEVQQAWTKHVYDTIKFYLFALGFLNIAVALLAPLAGVPQESGWIIFSLMALGSLLFLIGGLWEAQGAPAYEWTPACTVLAIGLLGILASVALEIYKILKWSGG